MFSHSSELLPVLLASAAVLAFAWTPNARAAEQKISGPFTHENLSIFFIHGPSADGPVPLTLDEALAKGYVEVSETGTVGELEIDNTGAEEVFVHAGDIVKGGRQDRVVTASLILKAKSGKVPLSVFCVESGRWSARGAENSKVFASANEMLPTRQAKLAMKSAYALAAAAPSAESGANEEDGDPSQRVEGFRFPENELGTRQGAGMTNRSIRGEPAGTSAADPQSEVWRSVSDIQAALSSKLGAKVSSETSETSLELALENEKLATARKGFMEALEASGEKEGDVVGLAFAINGHINSADIYPSNALFRKLWPRLLKAAVTEAIGAEDTSPVAAAAPAMTAATIGDFLKGAEAAKPSDQPSIDGQKLEMRAGELALDSATLRASGELVHRNVLARH